MSTSKGGGGGGNYAAPPGVPPRHAGDSRYCNRRLQHQQQQQKEFYEYQEFKEFQQQVMYQQEVIQMQMLQQQEFIQKQQQEFQLQQQQRQMRRVQVDNNGESSRRQQPQQKQQGDADDKRRGGGVVALAVPPSVNVRYNSKFTNLDRLVKWLTPYIPVQYFSSESSNARGRKPREPSVHPFFCLDALWDTFYEWSVYGAGVPLLLNGNEPVEQYYVPYLSGIQLYIDPTKASSQLKMSEKGVDAESCDSDTKLKSPISINRQQLDKPLGGKSSMSPSSSEADVANFPRPPTFQFMESEQPHVRKPLTDKASLLTSQHPELSNCRSCDLLPTSWICVAWYPIYRIPLGMTLKDVDSCFLTFHSLSTQSKIAGWPQTQIHPPNSRRNHGSNGSLDPAAKISLPVFGLASYKLKDAIVNLNVPQEFEQEKSLLKAADEWLKKLQVHLPDYQFFRSQPPYRR